MHRLTEVDRQALTAICAACGPVTIKLKKRAGGWAPIPRCAVKIATDQRNGHFVRRYGITAVEYDTLFAAQEGRCAICRQESERTLHVDHCHDSTKVRGLLCFSCNSILGNAKDDSMILASAIAYLDEHSRVEVLSA